MKEKLSNKRGITLIALVVTIIVLIILAGVSISLVLGDNGIVTKAKKAKVTYSQAQAREKLEMVLADLQADKAMDPEYDQEDYINKKIEDNDMEVEGDIVIVDGWQFEIDRTVPEIVNELPKLTEEEMLKPTITKLRTKRGLNEITVEIGLRNKEGTTITYAISKQEGEIEKTEAIADLQYTFENLERGEKYIITIEATNDYGTSIRRIEITIEMDTTKPQVTILEMKEEGKISEEFNVTYKLSDDTAIDINNCKYFYDLSDEKYEMENEVWNSASELSLEEGTITQSLEEEGNYYLHILAVDTSGNYESFVSNKIEITSNRLYLYSLGKQLNNHLTGGWIPEIVYGGEVYFQDDCIDITRTEFNGSDAWVRTNEFVDISDYTKFCIEFSTHDGHPADQKYMYIEAIPGEGLEDLAVSEELINFSADHVIGWIDISELNLPSILWVGSKNWGNIYIYKIWLE